VATTQNDNIEIGTDVPQIDKIIQELHQAETDTTFYRMRINQAFLWWRCLWWGQTVDGRKHYPYPEQFASDEIFPWEGASDTRMRTVAGIVREHVSIARTAFFKAKIQAQSVRPLIEDRASEAATRMLNWRVYNHMWAEVMRELSLAWSWRFALGTCLISVEWEQQRRLETYDLSLPVLDEVMQATGGADNSMLYLMDAIMDPKQEDQLTTLVQGLSPILSRPKARAIVKDLRELRVAKIPVAYPFLNQPRWTALRPCWDVLFPSETSDLQESRWVARREWVNETQLEDRIETDDYDPAFVEEAKKHKGESESWWSWSSGTWYNTGYNQPYPPRSYRDLIELFHFHYKAIEEGVPCVYKTIFNTLSKGPDTKHPLYAKHGPFEYEHGFYPYVVLRRTFEDRAILTSIGIAEEAYTDEQALKAQQDGLTDRTSIVHSPPMIVPSNKVQAMKGQRMPGAILGVSRPNEVSWMPLPPTDATPLEVIKLVQERLDRRYALFGAEVDPELKQLRQQELADEVLGEMDLVLDQTLSLMQQFELDSDVARVIGLGSPFKMGREEIQGKFALSARVDMRMLDPEYAAQKMELIGQALAFKQEGMLFNMAVEAIDPDAAAALSQSQISPAAQEEEKRQELAAVNQAMSGIESPLPINGNYQLRMQTLLGATIQSTNPLMRQRLQANPDSMQILQNRLKFYMDQIQQHTQNPIIGRALATQTFQRKMAPELTMGQPQ